MIIKLIRDGYRLAGYQDPRLTKGLSLAALDGCLLTVSYYIVAQLIVSIFNTTISLQMILLSAVGLLSCLLGRIYLSNLALSYVFGGTYAMMAEARIQVINHLHALPLGWFSAKRTGDLSVRLTSDLELIEGLWTHFLAIFTSTIVSMLLILALLCWIDIFLALLVIISIPFSFWVMTLTQRVINRYDEKMLDTASDAQAEIYDYIQGISVIRGFGQFGTAWKRLSNKLFQQYQAHLLLETKPAALVALFGFVSEFSFILLLVSGGYLLFQERLDIQHFILLNFFSLIVYRQLQTLGDGLIKLRFSSRAMERIKELMSETPVATYNDGNTSIIPSSNEITVQQVSFTYPEQSCPALQNIHCHIQSNAITAIVGPSGSGKSTLLQLIGQMWIPDSGQILWGEHDTKIISSEILHCNIAMVFQDVVLFSASVFDNILMGNQTATTEEVIQTAKLAQADEFIQQLPDGYQTILGDNGYSLSGGERQRLSIARALLKKAPIILLDEATASVDASTELAIHRVLENLSQHCTVVIVAHRLNTIQRAQKILVMDAGCLVEQGDHDTLLRQNGLYAQLWQRQQQSLSWQLTPSHEE
ncbi:ATP-binding cassette subfamily B protein [Frischella perrara]|uniref:ABC-type multidrug transport system, ATPase and permease component n=1 Tax=Frischella perrara TaxID=1267021 RepID=A0A0A7S8S4_FRIPE|nr:ABC transporter ATP-binding protein [Frischella perrara]AJA45716.1 ABC-type multidrug transport system, ATPase and permease component [Frischella perrara]PWV60332.1 ATP-binding cassette subfamily B protein [Frischella perrara]